MRVTGARASRGPAFRVLALVLAAAVLPTAAMGAAPAAPVTPVTPAGEPDLVAPDPGAPTPLGRVSATEDPHLLDAVQDASGRATIAWTDADGAGEVVVRTSDPGSAWSAPVLVSAAGRAAVGIRLGVDLAGRVTATWTDVADPTHLVMTATSDDGLTWTDPVELATTTGAAALGVDRSGRAVVSWPEAGDGTTLVQAATRTTDGTWSDVETLASREPDDLLGRGPDVGIDPLSGTATVVWADGPTLGSSRWTPGSGWVPMDAVPTTDGSTIVLPVVTVSGRNTSVAAWVQGGQRAHVVSAEASMGQPWGPALPIPLPAGYGDEFGQRALDISSNTGGDVVLAWDMSMLDYQVVFAASRTADGSWTTAAGASGDLERRGISAAIDAAGGTYVAWSGAWTAYLVGRAGEPMSEPFRFHDTYTYAHQGSALAAPVGDTTGGVVLARTVGDPATPSYDPTTLLVHRLPAVPPRTDPPATDSTTPTSTPSVPPRPVIRGFRLSRHRLTALEHPRARPRARPGARPAARRARLRVRLNTPARLRVVVSSRTKHHTGHGWRRVRVVLTRHLPAGTSYIRVRARLRHRPLPPDRYVLRARARNTTGASDPRRVRFRVVARR